MQSADRGRDRKESAGDTQQFQYAYKFIEVLLDAFKSKLAAENCSKARNPAKANEIRERLIDNLVKLHSIMRYDTKNPDQFKILRKLIHNVVLPEYLEAYIYGRYKIKAPLIGEVGTSRKDDFLDFFGDRINDVSADNDILKSISKAGAKKEDKEAKGKSDEDEKEMQKDKSTWLILSTLKDASCEELRLNIVTRQVYEVLSGLMKGTETRELFVNRWKAIVRMGGVELWDGVIDFVFKDTPLAKILKFPETQGPYVKDEAMKPVYDKIMTGKISFMDESTILAAIKKKVVAENILPRLQILIEDQQAADKKAGYKFKGF